MYDTPLPFKVDETAITLRVFVGRSVIETFAMQGRAQMSDDVAGRGSIQTRVRPAMA